MIAIYFNDIRRAACCLAVFATFAAGPTDTTRAADTASREKLAAQLEEYYEPRAEFAGKFGDYKSPLKFADGTTVKTPEDWARRRKEIYDTWQKRMGPWPSLLERPTVKRLETVDREGYVEHHVHVQVSADGKLGDGYLLIPKGNGPFPAVFVPFYEALTSIGRGPKGQGTHDYGLQLVRRGFVTLSIGTPGSFEKIGGDTRELLTEAGVERGRQPLSLLAYVAANCHTALAQLSEVDPARIGVVGLSYGGKWSMFASCLYDKFACAVWSDPGIVFNEKDPNVNYWEPWYLGYDPNTKRKEGVPSAENPRTGLYKELIDGGNDLVDLHALMAPRPVLVSGGVQDPPRNWVALNHLVAVNDLLGYRQRAALTARPGHIPNAEALELELAFLEYWLKPLEPKKIAAVVTEYRHNSHADVIVSRLFQTMTLDGQGEKPRMQLLSVFADQVPASDTSRKWSKEYGFQIKDTVADALTLGTGQLAVEGVLLVAEHGNYPPSPTGQTQYPKRRLFDEVVKVFRASKRSVPVFIDKHLADNWQDAKYIYDTARELKFPLMAGSSLPMAWRAPSIDVRRDAKLKQIVALSYGSIDAYGFHATELVQALAERRAGGETGVKSVECLVDQAVWEAGERGVYDPKLLDAALSRIKRVASAVDKKLSDVVPNPVLFVIDYADGLRANILTLNGAIGDFAAGWRYDDDSVESVVIQLQEGRPFMHFTNLLQGVDEMMQTGKATWPVERTLMSSGILDALHISKTDKSRRFETPYLVFSYQCPWNWRQPPPPPPERPSDQQ